MTGLIDFSLEAASNDTAAPPILWQEGQPAKTVNDSARNLMAALAAWHVDLSGTNAASGAAANALSLATAQVHKAATLAKGFTVAFTVDGTNTAPTTLNVDGTGTKPLRRPGSVELAPGDLGTGIIYRVSWHPVLAAYTLVSPEIGRPGRVQAFASEAAVPAGWVICDGRPLYRSQYAALYAVIGGAYGLPSGDTFQVPDLRGRGLFGVDATAVMGAAGRLTGAGGLAGTVASAGGSEAVALSTAQMPAHSHGGGTGSGGGTAATATGAGGGQAATSTGNAGGHSHTGSTGNAGGHTHSGSTSANGDHTHGYTTAGNKIAAGGTSSNGWWYGADASVNTTSAGSHSHSLNIDAVGDHAHSLTTNAAPDHAHTIPAVADHAHTIPAVAAHAHAIPTEGSGAAHPSVPPGLVVVFAIKA